MLIIKKIGKYQNNDQKSDGLTTYDQHLRTGSGKLKVCCSDQGKKDGCDSWRVIKPKKKKKGRKKTISLKLFVAKKQ